MRSMERKARSLAACALWLIALCAPLPAQERTPELKIDIDVRLKDARVVLNLDHLAYAGKEPFGLLYARILQEQFSADKTAWRVIAIFHGQAGYWSLNDAAYDRVRGTKSGNPYAKQIAALQAGGVRFEVCGQTARDNTWVNADFLPGIAVNSGANFRIIQLVRDGFVQIQP